MMHIFKSIDDRILVVLCGVMVITALTFLVSYRIPDTIVIPMFVVLVASESLLLILVRKAMRN